MEMECSAQVDRFHVNFVPGIHFPECRFWVDSESVKPVLRYTFKIFVHSKNKQFNSGNVYRSTGLNFHDGVQTAMQSRTLFRFGIGAVFRVSRQLLFAECGTATLHPMSEQYDDKRDGQFVGVPMPGARLHGRKVSE